MFELGAFIGFFWGLDRSRSDKPGEAHTVDESDWAFCHLPSLSTTLLGCKVSNSSLCDVRTMGGFRSLCLVSCFGSRECMLGMQGPRSQRAHVSGPYFEPSIVEQAV